MRCPRLRETVHKCQHHCRTVPYIKWTVFQVPEIRDLVFQSIQRTVVQNDEGLAPLSTPTVEPGEEGP